MRRSVLYTALALYVFGTPATAEERFEQWSLEPQGEGTFALAFKRPIPTQNGVGPELAFICNQESNYVVGILAPSPGTFKNEQESIPLAIQSLRTDTIPLTCCNAGKMKANISFRKSQASKKTYVLLKGERIRGRQIGALLLSQ